MIFDYDRYSRQIQIFGKEGQEKLAEARVLVVGAGGLGSAVIAYLAAAGVGRLGIVDGDIVEKSNLQRQIIHGGKVGENKAESAAEFVEKINPEVVVDIYPYNVNPYNVEELVKPYDVIVGCPDNFEVRYILNDECIKEGKPFVHAAVYSMEGELAVFEGSPCYRCYLPNAPETTGRAILGATAGVFGCLQAAEVVKLITGYGEVLKGKVLRGDLYSMTFFTIELAPREGCLCTTRSESI